MEPSGKRKLAAGAAAALVVAGGGAAVAASRFGGSPREESQAVIADAAKQLGVEPSKLSDALKKALEDRVDAAVAAGRMTKAEGDALKARIESADVPLIFPGFRPGGFPEHRPLLRAGLDTAATYLGLTEAQLRNELENGKTLAQIATEHGNTADGLVNALLDAAKQRLDAAVAAGRLTRADENDLLAGLKDRITNLVNGRLPLPSGERFRDHRFGFRGPPPLFGPPAGP